MSTTNKEAKPNKVNKVTKRVESVESSSVKTYVSPTWSEIQKYESINSLVKKFSNLLPTEKLPTEKVSKNKYLVTIKENKYLQKSLQLFQWADSIVALFVFEIGINCFISNYKKKNGKLGSWVIFFIIDYIANVINHLLLGLIIKPFKFVQAKTNGKGKEVATDSNLPHVEELTVNTKELSKQIGEKVNKETITAKAMEYKGKYVDQTKDKALEYKDKYVGQAKDTAIKYTEPYVEHAKELTEPYVEQAKDTIKIVTENYESNLKKNDDNIPKAIYNTGLELGSLTVEKINNGLKRREEAVTN